MKKILLFLFLFGFFLVFALDIDFELPTLTDGTTTSNNWIYVNVSASDSQNISTFIDFNNSLVAWFRMEANQTADGALFYDNSSYGNNGTGVNNANQTTDGYFGDGLNLDGKDDYITIPLSSSLNTTSGSNWTFSAWINAKHLPNSNKNILYTAEYYVSPKGGIRWYTFGSFLYFTVLNSSGSSVHSRFSFSTNEWVHAIAIYNGTHTSIYKNGVLIDSDLGVGIGHTNHDWKIGDDFNGTIDDFMVFNRVLTNDEILGLYANTSSKYLEVNFTNLANGDYPFTAYAQDTDGNVNSTTRTITIGGDTTYPNITINSPLNNTSFTLSYLNISLNLLAQDETAISTYWWSRDGGVTNYTFLTNQTWISWGESAGTKSYIITACVNDTSNNINCTDIFITVTILKTITQLVGTGPSSTSTSPEEIELKKEIIKIKKWIKEVSFNWVVGIFAIFFIFLFIKRKKKKLEKQVKTDEKDKNESLKSLNSLYRYHKND